MSGWFSDNDGDRRRREDRIAAEDAIERRKKIAIRKKQRAEFQKKIDEEVQKHFEDLSPEAKKERIEKLHGASSLLNGALGQEFAVKGRNGASPWMSSPGLQSKSLLGSSKKDVEANSKEAVAAAAPEKVIRLTRPY